MDLIGSIDPFFVIKFGGGSQKTTVKKGTPNPKYNEIFDFPCEPSQTSQPLMVECFDWDSASKSEFACRVQIQFSEFLTSPVNKWFELRDDKYKTKGEVQLEVIYTPRQGSEPKQADNFVTNNPITQAPSNPPRSTVTRSTAVPQTKRNYIPASHPLIVYAQYDYQPAQQETSGPVLDSANQPLEAGFHDIALKENRAYLLKRDEYPWPEWSSVIPLQYASQEEINAYYAANGGSQEQLYYLETPATSLGGFAPTAYFKQDYYVAAKGQLLNNPENLTTTLKLLVAQPLPPYLPASNPLVVYAAYDYAPAPPQAGPVLDINNQPLEAGFADIALKENYPYLLKRGEEYPWPEWSSVIPLQFCSQKEIDGYFAVKGGQVQQLYYLENSQNVIGGFAPTAYFKQDYLAPAKNHLLSNPGSLKQALAVLGVQG